MILTIRTDKPEAEIGLFDEGKQLAYEKWQAHRQLAETIHQKIDALLVAQGWTLSNLRGVVVYRGPGSFTGLRIGISVANALAYGLAVPIVGETGDDWQQRGIKQLLDGEDEKMITPLYGSAAHITPPKK